MVLKLYAVCRCASGRRVASILYEKNIPFQLIEPDWPALEHKTPAWTAKQPFGQMPYIDDDGFILFESRAIMKYIATKYASSGPDLMPTPNDLKALALFDQGISIEMSNFNPAAEAIYNEKVMKPIGRQEPDQVLIAYNEVKLKEKIPGFEAFLGKQKYMAGDKITIVDFFFLPYGKAITDLGYHYLVNAEKYPNLTRWWSEISNRESWQKTMNAVPTEGIPEASK